MQATALKQIEPTLWQSGSDLRSHERTGLEPPYLPERVGCCMQFAKLT